jgi:RNA polymerase sigma factor (sigma-70 family)
MPHPDDSYDREVIQRFRAGDREAFAAVYRTESPALQRVALYLTGDQVKAADLTQDVFVWLIHHAEDFDPARGRLRSFLIGVARKLLQRQRHAERRWLPLTDAPELVTQDVDAMENSLPQSTQAAALQGAIAALPLRYRAAVVLCDLEGKSYEEAAVMLECPVGTVRSRLHRARLLLARKLQASHGEVEKSEVGKSWV